MDALTDKIQNSIARRLLWAVLCLGILLTLLFSGVQAWREYRLKTGALSREMNDISQTLSPGISTALWGFDRQTLVSQAEGILHFPYIKYVEIRGKGDFHITSGSSVTRNAVAMEFPLTHDYNNRQVVLGSLYLEADTSEVIHAVFSSFKTIFFFQFLTVAIASLFILLMFNRLVTRHIARAAAYFQTFEVGSNSPRLQLKKKPVHDEIDILVEAFNAMREKLNLSYQQLSNQEEWFRLLIQQAPFPLAVSTREGVIAYLNDRFIETFGYSLTDIPDLEAWWQQAYPDVDYRNKAAEKWRSLEEAAYREKQDISPEEYRISCKDGKTRIVLIGAATVLERVVFVFNDITERKQLEEQLHQSQKMESIGRLAGGVAHDFNNMLSVILGYAQQSMLKVPEGDKLWKNLNEICKAAERSRDITRQLLAFSRKELISPRQVNLNTQIVEAEKNLVRLIGEDVKLSFRPATDLWTVKVDPSQFDQILINLAVNARDAMPEGGTIMIETANVTIDEAYCHYHVDARPGDYAMVMVSDTGIGMDSETRKHIFEPFFTTKEVGKGTGLGLATIFGIVSQNNGFINVYSEPAHGSTFTTYLPRCTEDAHDELLQPKGTVSGTGSILVVEDDQTVLSMTIEMLGTIGYTVHPVSDPNRAIELCADPGLGFDLIISDVVMPGMSGKEMVTRIRQVRPDVKVLYMSGYTSDIIAQKGILEEGTHFIHKPFDMSTLNEKIKETLRSAA